MIVFAIRMLLLFAVVGTAALVSPRSARAADHGDPCALAKLRASKAYHACLMKQEIRAIKKGEPADPTKCNQVFARKWDNAEARAAGDCYSTDEQAEIQGGLASSAIDTADVLTEIPGVPQACGFTAPACNGECPADSACVPAKQCGDGASSCSTDADCAPFGCMTGGCSCMSLEDMKTVFVTSDSHEGDLGGLAGADATCQQHAVAAGLSGTYRAWLSDTNTDAQARLTHATVPYVRTDGLVVANDWVDLTDGVLAYPIELDEDGNVATGIFFTDEAWTCTDAAGNGICDGSCSFVSEIGNTVCLTACDNWTNAFATGDAGAWDGNFKGTDASWTQSNQTICFLGRQLYCLEQ